METDSGHSLQPLEGTIGIGEPIAEDSVKIYGELLREEVYISKGFPNIWGEKIAT